MKRGEVATIIDVARMAQVAPSTVSYALNGTRPVAPATRSRIREAVEALGYVPHPGARSLRTAVAGTFGVVLPGRKAASSGLLVSRLYALLRAADREGLHLVLMTPQQTATDPLKSGRVDGLILLGAVSPAESAWDEITLLDRTVAIDTDSPMRCAEIGLDYEWAGRLVARRLGGTASMTITIVRRAGSKVTEALMRGISSVRRQIAVSEVIAESADEEAGIDATVSRVLEAPTIIVEGAALAQSLHMRLERESASPRRIVAIIECADRTQRPFEALTFDDELIAETAIRTLRRLLAGETIQRRHLVRPTWSV